MKKAQLKIQQTAFMLLAVTLFFVLVGMFVFGFKFSDLKESSSLLEEKNAVLLASKLADSPEFSCGNSFNYGEAVCIDADKVMMLKQHIQNYDSFWGISNIEIRKIYPKTSGNKLCNLGNYPDCNTIRLISENVVGTDASTFVALCSKQGNGEEYYDKCELAKLMISYEKT